MEDKTQPDRPYRVVRSEDTLPVHADSNEIRKILQELARRTAEMEYRLDRILRRSGNIEDKLYRVGDTEQTESADDEE